MRAIKFLLFTDNDLLRLLKCLRCNNEHFSNETHISLMQRSLNIPHSIPAPHRAQIMLFGEAWDVKQSHNQPHLPHQKPSKNVPTGHWSAITCRC